MFITKVKFFNEYCEILFPWLEKCLTYCKNNNLVKIIIQDYQPF